jgi:hypothetical protein
MHGDTHMIQFFILIKFLEENFTNLKTKYSFSASSIAKLLEEIFFLLIHETFRDKISDGPLWNAILDLVCWRIYKTSYNNGPHSPYALHVTLLSPSHPLDNIRKYLLLSWTKQLENIKNLMKFSSIEDAFKYCTDTPLEGTADNKVSKISPQQYVLNKRAKKHSVQILAHSQSVWCTPGEYSAAVIFKENPSSIKNS